MFECLNVCVCRHTSCTRPTVVAARASCPSHPSSSSTYAAWGGWWRHSATRATGCSCCATRMRVCGTRYWRARPCTTPTGADATWARRGRGESATTTLLAPPASRASQVAVVAVAERVAATAAVTLTPRTARCLQRIWLQSGEGGDAATASVSVPLRPTARERRAVTRLQVLRQLRHCSMLQEPETFI
jgi:hypothetical protein